MSTVFIFDGLLPVARVLFITFFGYVVLLLLLRVSGQRTLAQLSSLDLVITVTLGSAFGRVITAREVALAEVVAAFTGLIALQWLVAAVWGRLPRVRRAIGLRPALLYYDGEVMRPALRRTHLREEDLRVAVRQQGLGSLSEARAVVLEANGSFAVLPADRYGDGAALGGISPGA